MIEQWFHGWCPTCKTENWICNGDPNDVTVSDIDGIKCWNCAREFLLSEDDLYSHDDEEFAHNYAKGRRFEEKSVHFSEGYKMPEANPPEDVTDLAEQLVLVRAAKVKAFEMFQKIDPKVSIGISKRLNQFVLKVNFETNVLYPEIREIDGIPLTFHTVGLIKPRKKQWKVPPTPWKAEDIGDGNVEIVDAEGKYIFTNLHYPLAFVELLVSKINASASPFTSFDPWPKTLDLDLD